MWAACCHERDQWACSLLTTPSSSLLRLVIKPSPSPGTIRGGGICSAGLPRPADQQLASCRLLCVSCGAPRPPSGWLDPETAALLVRSVVAFLQDATGFHTGEARLAC